MRGCRCNGELLLELIVDTLSRFIRSHEWGRRCSVPAHGRVHRSPLVCDSNRVASLHWTDGAMSPQRFSHIPTGNRLELLEIGEHSLHGLERGELHGEFRLRG